jgi:AcrR family transcriptional regulator
MSDRRSAILEAAISVIARRGVRGLRVEEVAAEAGVAVSLIYYHFGNRAGLVRGTLEHANEHDAAAMRELEQHERSGRALVEATLLASFADDEDSRKTSIVWGEVVASAAFDHKQREHLQQAYEAWRELVSRSIRDGIEDGSVAAGVDADDAAVRLIATAEGIGFHCGAGLLARERARELMRGAIAAELGPA